MFKGLGNLSELLKQAQEMKGRMGEMQEKLAQTRVQGEAGGGMVVVEATGHQKILSCKFDPALLASGDQEMLEDLFVAAVNQALEKSREAAQEEMSNLTGNLNLPGLGDALSKFGMGG